MHRTRKQEWMQLVLWLRRTFPAPAPCMIRTVPLDVCGDCRRINSEYIVRVKRHDPFRLKVDTLIHEWAHVLTWDTNLFEDHCGCWGRTYAKIYRAFLVWDYGKSSKEK